MGAASRTHSDLIEVRRSKVHGLGVFAKRRIPKGTRIIEYVGQRVSHDEADRRYEDKAEDDSHTFLFIVDSKTVIDAGADGNDARFFNHSCDPNCESVVQSKRVYIDALREIEPGAELTYDYQIQREDDDPDNIDEVFACRCGFAACRGTMLWPTERKAKRKARKKKTVARGKTQARSKTKAAKKPAKKRSQQRVRAKKSVLTQRAGRRR
jgi:SET domain-containing protein